MKILLDENVAQKIKKELIKLGLKDVTHINDFGKGLPDEKVFELAMNNGRIIVTGDDDFKDNNFKYKIPIIWITPKGRKNNNIPLLIKWILDNLTNYNINIENAFITIQKNKYIVEYRNRKGVFGKIKTKEINFDKIDISAH